MMRQYIGMTVACTLLLAPGLLGLWWVLNMGRVASPNDAHAPQITADAPPSTIVGCQAPLVAHTDENAETICFTNNGNTAYLRKDGPNISLRWSPNFAGGEAPVAFPVIELIGHDIAIRNLNFAGDYTMVQIDASARIVTIFSSSFLSARREAHPVYILR